MGNVGKIASSLCFLFAKYVSDNKEILNMNLVLIERPAHGTHCVCVPVHPWAGLPSLLLLLLLLLAMMMLSS